jgi:HAD superfamily hydrolase (TIGR01549 family)
MFGSMVQTPILSFDLEGTLVDTEFSHLVWEIGLPALYAEEYGLQHEAAVDKVMKEYSEIGPDRIEWYDLKYWFRRFNLNTGCEELLEKYRGSISTYPEVKEVLGRLSEEHQLIMISNTSREFMKVMTQGLEKHFTKIFSAPTDFRMLKFPALYVQVCSNLNVKPSDVIHVGDHVKFDLESARGAGIRSFLLDRTGKNAGDHVVTDLKSFEIKVSELRTER